MGVILPQNNDEVINRIQTDVKSELDNSNPWLVSSFLRSIAVGLGNRVYDYYYQLKQVLLQAFPNTATGEYLDFWAFLRNISPLTATPGNGKITINGTLGSTAGVGDIVTIGSLEYELDDDIEIVNLDRTVSNLTASGTTALCITDEDHNYATGNTVTISGVNEAGWDGSYEITVTDLKSFTFAVPLGLISPATGAILATQLAGSGFVTCTENGTGTNQDGGVEMTFQTPIPGIDDLAITQFEGLQGGIDDESTESYQDRIVQRWRNPETPFNPAKISSTIKKINGNTRVWVHRVTPEIGQVTAYFVRDNDATIIPEQIEVDAAKQAVVDISPANTAEEDIIIEAPSPVLINVTLSGLVPDRLSMRQAVENQIDSFYRGSLAEGEDHRVDKLKSQIEQTYDVSSGEGLQNYTLVQPTVDQNIDMGEIAVQGTVVINA